MTKYWLGKKRSKETIEKISKTKKANPTRYWLGKHHSKETIAKIPTFKKGHIPWNKGKQLSEELRKKLSNSHKGKKQSEELIRKRIKIGEKSAHWKGGITPKNRKIRCSIEFRLWREAVFARDNWTCQKCKIKGGEFHPHHILNFAEWIELRFAIDNGATLCKKCHKEFHDKYGRRNNTLGQFREFIGG